MGMTLGRIVHGMVVLRQAFTLVPQEMIQRLMRLPLWMRGLGLVCIMTAIFHDPQGFEALWQALLQLPIELWELVMPLP